MAAQLHFQFWSWQCQREANWMELRGGEGNLPHGREGLTDCRKAAARPNTPSEQLLARYIYFSMKMYQLLLLCLSLELLLWPSGISLGFWCHAWGWCDSPAWTAEEMSDFHLCSTLEIQKEENLLEEMPSCSFPSKLLFVICQTNRCHWRQTLVSNVLLDYQNMQQIIILIIKH